MIWSPPNADLLIGRSLLQRQVGAVRLPDVPLPRLEARDVALVIEADPAQHRVELAAVHGQGHRIEIKRARRLHRLGPDLNRGVGVERESQRLVTLRPKSRHDLRRLGGSRACRPRPP